MKQKQDGKGVADYVADTEADIEGLVKAKGDGGKGIHETAQDAALNGVTPDLARQRAEEAATRPMPDEE